MRKSKQLLNPEDELAQLIQESGAQRGTEIHAQQRVNLCYHMGSLGLGLAIGEIDPVTGLAGVPARSIVELYGRTGTLKSGTAFSLIRSVQQADPSNVVVGLFSEEPNTRRMLQEGLDLERLIMLGCYDPDQDKSLRLAETGLDAVCQFAEKPYVKLCVIDSIGALPIGRDIFDDKGKIKEFDASNSFGNRAKTITKFLNTYSMVNQNSILLMTNHEKDKIQPVGFAPRNIVIGESLRESTMGGTGKDFYCHLRIKCSTRPWVSDEVHPLFGNKPQVGLEVIYKVAKNFFAPGIGSRTVVSKFSFETGSFNIAEETFIYAEYLGLIEAATSRSWVVGDERLVGKEKVIELLETNHELREKLQREIIARSNELFKIQKPKAAKVLE